MLILYLSTALILFGSGCYFTGRIHGASNERAAWIVRMDAAQKLAKEKTDALQVAINQASIAQRALVSKQTKASAEVQKKLQESLAKLGHCIVPGGAIRVLNDSEHMSNNAGPATRAIPTATPPDSTLAEQLNVCVRNYQERYIPLAEQTKALQKLWSETQKKINKP